MNIRILSQNDMKQSITMLDAIAAMKEAFLQLAHKEVEQPLRTSIPIASKHAVTLTMPAYLKQSKQLGIKIVSSFPENPRKNLPSIHGIIVLLDANTGIPIAFMEAAYLTALRTGAISGLATDILAKKDAKSLCIIGSGAQAYTQLEAVTTVRNIEKITVWSRTYQNAVDFARSLQGKYTIEPVEHLRVASQEADIICTATNSETPLIHHADIKPDVHINAIGSHSKSMQEIAADVIAKADIIVDQKEAALLEAGELMAAIENTHLDPSRILEIGDLLGQKSIKRMYKTSLFKSVGLAIQDVSIAHLVYQLSCKKQLGFNYDLS